MFDYSFITRETEKIGYVGIYVRITIQESRAEISLKRTVAFAKWDAASGRVKGNTAEAKEINQYLEAGVVTHPYLLCPRVFAGGLIVEKQHVYFYTLSIENAGQLHESDS